MDNYRTDQFRHSFFIDSVIKWNHLRDRIVHAETVQRDYIRALSQLECKYQDSLSTFDPTPQKIQTDRQTDRRIVR